MLRLAKSFTIEADINDYVDETKGDRSASERVNELLRLAILQERYGRLEAEAAEYFADYKAEANETKQFQRAALKTLRRDGCLQFNLRRIPGVATFISCDWINRGPRSSSRLIS